MFAAMRLASSPHLCWMYPERGHQTPSDGTKQRTLYFGSARTSAYVATYTTRLRLAPNIDPASYRSQCGDHQRKSNTALHRGTADAQTIHALQAERSRIAHGPLRWQRSRYRLDRGPG